MTSHEGSNLQDIMSPFSGPLHFLFAFMPSVDNGIYVGFCYLARKGLFCFLALVIINEIISVVF